MGPCEIARADRRVQFQFGGGQPQQEKAAREQQMAASGQELVTSEEKMTSAEPQAADQQTGAGESADRRGHRLGETKTA